MSALPSSFTGLGIAPNLLQRIEHLRFVTPTAIQHKAIPVALEGHDIVGVAQTGTGKTLSFAVPILQRLAQNPGKALVLVPTRELALQVEEDFRKLNQNHELRSVVLIGGVSFGQQLRTLYRKPRVLIATPGRLLDHLKQKSVSLSDVHILVLDEADRMLDMGFAPDIARIIHFVPKSRQTMLFSATMPADIVKLATAYMRLPFQIEVAPPGTAAEKVTQELFIVKKESKNIILKQLLAKYHGSILLFSRTKHGARHIAHAVRTMGHRSAEIHSDRSLDQRREALEGFKSGKYRILVATDIASRGIDVKGIELVINYDLPDDAENYVHRIGRTGRAGQEGHAISLATPDQRKDVRNIEAIIKTVIPISKHPDMPLEEFSKPQVVFNSSRFSRGRRRPIFRRRR